MREPYKALTYFLVRLSRPQDRDKEHTDSFYSLNESVVVSLS